MTLSDKLVPSSGILWGAAAGGFTSVPSDVAVKTWEQLAGRTVDVFHTYHRGDEKFPTKAEIAMARGPGHPRLLLLNWKVAWGSTWAKVAGGAKDARIHAFADRIKKTFPEPFFLVLHHEPENDVDPKAGSGMTAKDYAAMYRHVILRLRALGVTNIVSVMAYMGVEKHLDQKWWSDLYPGNDVVDWIGLDAYLNAEPGYHHGDFASLLDRRGKDLPQGFYNWVAHTHPQKPLMIAEWGVYHRSGATQSAKERIAHAGIFDTVLPELAKRPAIKAMVYFDTPKDQQGFDMRINSSSEALAAFRRVAAAPIFET